MNIKKILISTGAAVAMLGAMITPAFAAVGGPTCNVPADYATIQTAVNDSSCTTVNVAAGTYAESVAINHALILNGPNAGISGNGARVSEATVNDINITAGSVIVDGFSFATAGSQVNINGSATLSGVKVQNNIFSGYGSVGMPTYNAGNLLITKNLFKTPLASTEAMQIKADSSKPGGCNGTVVSDNVFTAASNNGGADINFSCTGSNSTGVTVSGNTDTGLADANGTSFTAFSGVTDGIVVTNNHVTGTLTSGSAIFFFGNVTGTALINGNTVTGGGGSAVSIHGGDITSDTKNSGTFTITNNVLSGNTRGINVAANVLTSTAQVTANQNDVSGDTAAGIANDPTNTVVVNGTCNWWGAANGPGPVGPGAGSNVTTGVNYTPWLTTSNLNGSCNGPLVGPPTHKDQCKDNGWKTFNNPTFKNRDQCIDYVERHSHKVNGDVKYNAYGLNREAEFDMNTADNNGTFSYTDANKDSYKVKVSSVNVSGNTAWFAGVVTKSKNNAYNGQWLFAKVVDNSPDKIWGSFTIQATAEAGVTNMTDPANGPFNVTNGNLRVN